MTTCPRRARVPVAVLAGVANAWLWLHVVDAVLHRRRVPRAFPVAPVGIAGVLVLVVGGTTAGFALAKTPVLHFVSPAEAATQWNPSVDAGGRHAARGRHRFQHQVGRPRRSVRARRPSAVALLVSRHDPAARRCRTPPTTRTARCPTSCGRSAIRCPRTTAPPAGGSRSSPRVRARCSPRRTWPRRRARRWRTS